MVAIFINKAHNNHTKLKNAVKDNYIYNPSSL